MIEQGATLIYYKDVPPADADFKMVQFMGLRGYLPDWEAGLAKPLDKETARLWERLSGKKVNSLQSATKRDILLDLYRQLKAGKP